MVKFCRSKYGILFAVGVVLSLWLLIPSLKRETLLVPVHSDLDGAEDVVISLFPPDPILREGDSFQLVCTATGTEQVYFELPKLAEELTSSIETVQQLGQATLTFNKLELGHQATYTCHAVSVERGVHKYRRFPLALSSRKEQRRNWDELGVDGRGEVGREGGEWVGEKEDDLREGGEWTEDKREGEKLWEEEGREGGEEQLKKEEAKDAAREYAVDSQFPVFETMEDRAEYQREKVDEFCTRFGLNDFKYQLPTPAPNNLRGKQNEVYSYNRHLLLDDKHDILFCFVPKIGCTNLKLLVFVSQGIIRRSELRKARDEVDQRALEGAMFRNSFISVKDDSRKVTAIQSYYKYTMFRNPLERLASGFRSKVERFPLVGLNLDSPHFNWFRMDIYKAAHPQEFKVWKMNKGKKAINITFPDFIDYWTHNSVLNKVDGYLDEHFLMITEMCQPCRTRFDFYGNFRHFARDAQVLIDKIGGSSSDLRQGYYSDDTASTDSRMRLYYSSLSLSQKRDILGKMALELEFHYTIIPEERDSHKLILGIDNDLPL